MKQSNTHRQSNRDEQLAFEPLPAPSLFDLFALNSDQNQRQTSIHASKRRGKPRVRPFAPSLITLLFCTFFSVSTHAQNTTSTDTASEKTEASFKRKTIAVLPPKGNLEEWPEFEVELAFHAVKLFQQAGMQVFGPGQVTSTLKNAGASECESTDWIECAMHMREALGVDEVVLFQLIMLRGKPDQLTLLVVNKEGLQTSHTIRAEQGEETPKLIQRLLFEALPEIKDAVKQNRAESADSLSEPSSKLEQGACPGANLVDVQTETQYPIVGPSILGVAGVALTSLAIVAGTKSRCKARDASGQACLVEEAPSTAATLGYGITGGAALASAVMWFVLGQEEVPVEIEVSQTQTSIALTGQF